MSLFKVPVYVPLAVQQTRDKGTSSLCLISLVTVNVYGQPCVVMQEGRFYSSDMMLFEIF